MVEEGVYLSFFNYAHNVDKDWRYMETHCSSLVLLIEFSLEGEWHIYWVLVPKEITVFWYEGHIFQKIFSSCVVPMFCKFPVYDFKG